MKSPDDYTSIKVHTPVVRAAAPVNGDQCERLLAVRFQQIETGLQVGFVAHATSLQLCRLRQQTQLRDQAHRVQIVDEPPPRLEVKAPRLSPGQYFRNLQDSDS